MTKIPDCRLEGTVKWFDKSKGYGFIAVEGREKDIFFHAKQWNPVAGSSQPQEGEPLAFTLVNGPKGDFAIDLVRKGVKHASRF